MPVTIKNQIINHICYRDVFNAPVSIELLKKWIGINQINTASFNDAIYELKSEKLIVQKDEYLAIYPKYEFIEQQAEKSIVSEKLINRGRIFLTYLSKVPLIKYIGISGSLAADNPTIGTAGVNKGVVDLDLFIISAKNTLWIFFLLERVYTNVQRLIFGHHFYCFNYVTDESFLEVHNKNFYTATEIINLKTIYDDGVYDDFMVKNKWSEKFYNNLYGHGEIIYSRKSFSWLFILWPLNFLCFILFCLGRGLKRLEWEPILEMFNGFNPVQKCNLKRLSNPNGGYQEALKARFLELYKMNFPGYYSKQMMEHLFPAYSAFQITKEKSYDLEHEEMFTKYSLSQDEKNTI